MTQKNSSLKLILKHIQKFLIFGLQNSIFMLTFRELLSCSKILLDSAAMRHVKIDSLLVHISTRITQQRPNAVTPSGLSIAHQSRFFAISRGAPLKIVGERVKRK